MAKEFIRYIYTDEDFIKYTLETILVNRSVVDKYKDQIRMLEAYGNNNENCVDSTQRHLNWQGVRDAFYTNIKDLLLESKTH